ncbi:MAG: molybdopterin-dependent oxidoreductase [Chloroflexi bacterium]|nr:molybdopterin-dependent oxidoreductase [Chloroflexota bacterium]
MEEHEKENEVKGISRRDFIRGAGLAVGGAAAGAVVAYGILPAKVVTKEVEKEVVKAAPTAAPVAQPVSGTGVIPPALEPEKEFIGMINTVAAVDVKNGRIIRMRPIHYDAKYPNLKPWSITARGKTFTPPMKSPVGAMVMARRKRTDSPNRVLYPLKRVDWEPGGDPAKINAQNRGLSKYKRISWDEAAKIIAGEIDRVAKKYGTEGISTVYSGGHSEGHNVQGSHGVQTEFLHYYLTAKYGSTLTDAHGRATTSSGGQLGGRYVWGMDYEATTGLLKDTAENCEMLVGWACNLRHTWRNPNGMTQIMLATWFKELGIKRVQIDPVLNNTTGLAIQTDKWIPIVPNTDGALAAAIANVWVTEGTYDKNYLANHAVGFDKWEAYVMGKEDGVPKTPKWASAITGIPVWTIKALAREWAKKKTSLTFGARGGGANGRTIYGDNVNRMQIYLLAMQGWGRSGVHQIVNGLGDTPSPTKSPSVGGVAASGKITAAMTKETNKKFTATDTNRQFIPRDDLYDAIWNPPVDWWYYDDNPLSRKRTYPLAGKSEVHLIWATSQSFSGSRAAGNLQRKAFTSPKIECHVTQAMWLEDCMKYSDIILPIATSHETDDIFTANDVVSSVMLNKQMVKPKGEAKSDLEAVLLVADKLGFANKINEGKSYGDLIQARIKEGYEASGVKDAVTWEKLSENLYFSQPMDPKTLETPPPALAFYNDPAKSPLRTPSGKLEFESALLKENFPDDKERAPVAKYCVGGPASAGWTHDENPHGERAKAYPMRMVSQTNDWLHHSQYVDVPWSREARGYVIGWDGYAYAPVWINPVDAKARGIETGDIVRIYNELGSVLAGAVVTEGVMAGAMRLDKAGGDDQIALEVNRGGNPNSINRKQPMHKHGYGLAAQFYLCQIEKLSGAQMDEWRKKYPEAFKRDYDPAYGPLFSGWVEEGVSL